MKKSLSIKITRPKHKIVFVKDVLEKITIIIAECLIITFGNL